MNAAITTATSERVADRLLKSAAVFWFLIAAAGQWLFVVFILGFYGAPTLTGNFAAWDKNELLTHGYVKGDTVGNLAFAAHVILAAILTFGGTLQLVPQIRARAISFHRWNGRLFILTAFVISLTGLLLHATRDNILDHLAITLNAVLIMYCAGQTIGYALAGDIAAHRRWALRTFIVVNGVWFLRVGVFGWMTVKVGLLGGPDDSDSNFFAFWSYGSYLVPLALLELYLLAQTSRGALMKTGTALLLLMLAVGTAIGIVGVATIVWFPLLTTT